MCEKYIAYRNELLLFLVTNMFWSLHCPAFYFRAQCVPHWGKRTGVVGGGHERPLPNKGLTSLLLPPGAENPSKATGLDWRRPV